MMMMAETVEPKRKGWTLTLHAAKRMIEMDVYIEEVLLACAKPEVTYPGAADHPGKENCRTHQHGRIAVIVDPIEKNVVTVLWRTTEEYSRTEKKE